MHFAYLYVHFREVLKIHSGDDSRSLVLELGTPEKNAEDSEVENLTECSNDEEIASDSNSSELSAVKEHDT